MSISTEERAIVRNWIKVLRYRVDVLNFMTDQLQQFETGSDPVGLPEDVRKLLVGGNVVKYVSDYGLSINLLIELMSGDFWQGIDPGPDIAGHDFSQARFAIVRGVWRGDEAEIQPYAVENDRYKLAAAADYLPSPDEAVENGRQVTPPVYVIIHTHAAVEAFRDALQQQISRLNRLAFYATGALLQVYLEDSLQMQTHQTEADFFQTIILRAAFLEAPSRLPPGMAEVAGDLGHRKMMAIWLRDPRRPFDDERDQVETLLTAWLSAEG